MERRRDSLRYEHSSVAEQPGDATTMANHKTKVVERFLNTNGPETINFVLPHLKSKNKSEIVNSVVKNRMRPQYLANSLQRGTNRYRNEYGSGVANLVDNSLQAWGPLSPRFVRTNATSTNPFLLQSIPYRVSRIETLKHRSADYSFVC